MPSFSHDVAELGAELVGGALVLLAIVAVARRLAPERLSRQAVLALGLAGLGVTALMDLRGAASTLARAHRDRVTAQMGREHCVMESINGLPVSPRAAGFLAWVRRRLPAHAQYALAGYTGSPDAWCITMILLPALPGPSPDWVLALGTIPREMQVRIARHDPDVTVYAPGYALERVGRS